MLSPIECIGFEKCVMVAFDNKEYVSNWERLRGKKLSGATAMRLFIKDVRNLLWDRMPVVARRELYQ